ncbi:hypothetical protein NBRC3280_2678 [Acetobacter pasteurianus NBRC 3280]|uniref:Uncharacterized protein n=1 Tax=Acetobacter pasteurianus NBRC 3278 TaxID=1226660 RepID=A0A401X6S0_ACEPA|nr:hypothetical protein NBRC3277_2566 [Acetobacter pasteurianus NBRC 3277]GCD63622.1 hypothetical protein NBRC3278_2715 [Acetobacter pasteurianus NBRC 3278]GCD70043.1 hypothetical protein NBRC3280_2678 [Acetobacter pasteurianus NBRC 3280]
MHAHTGTIGLQAGEHVRKSSGYIVVNSSEPKFFKENLHGL